MRHQLSFLGLLSPQQEKCLPDWMMVAPPKTGTTWLSDNLRLHSQIYVPPVKEVKYFSNRFESYDFRWYLDQFRDGIGKSKGESPPSYSLLPRGTIRLIRQLMPDLKLIFLLRDPIDRAWSHARHCFRYREAGFKGHTGSINEVTDAEWIDNLHDDWNRLAGDYLGQLQRWLSAFPHEQMMIGLFDDIVAAPRDVLRRTFRFLNVDEAFADSDRVTEEAANVGIARDIPRAVEAHLIDMYASRTRELATFLADEFRLEIPNSWRRRLDAPNTIHKIPQTHAGRFDCAPELNGIPQNDDWQAGDAKLAGVLARDDLINVDFLGFHIIRREGQFRAYRSSLGTVHADDRGSDWWDSQIAAGHCVAASNIYDLKSAIVRAVVSQTMPPGSDAARLRNIELQLEDLERRDDNLQATCGEASRLVASFLEQVGEKPQSPYPDQGGLWQRIDSLEMMQRIVQQQVQQLCQTQEAISRQNGQQASHLHQHASQLEMISNRLAEISRHLGVRADGAPSGLLQRVSSRIERVTNLISFPGTARHGSVSEPPSGRDAA